MTAERPRWLQILRAVPLLLGAVLAAFFVWVVIQRFVYPVELEWMSGGVTEHVNRLLHGEPLYVAPSARFIPYLYPPLHYALSALVAHLVPVNAATRLVSVIATLATGFFVYRVTRRIGGTTYWALVALSLFIGGYSVTGYWYDLDRADTLATALLGAAFLSALGAETLPRAVLTGVLCGVAFFAKQPALIYLFAIVWALGFTRNMRLAAATALGAAVVLVPGLAWLNAASHGWFWFYVIRMPASHGIDPRLFTVFFVLDASKIFLTMGAVAAVLAFGVPAVRKALAGRFAPEALPSRTDALFFAVVGASLFVSATSRLHAGGWLNVLIFVITFGAVAVGVVGTRLARTVELEAVLTTVVILQLVHLLYDPGEAMPNEGRVRDARIVEDRIRELEKKGEVVVAGRANLTKEPHFHFMALLDVLRMHLPVPDDLRAGLSERRYAAYVVDEFGELGFEPVLGTRSELYELLLRNYFVAQRLDDREPPPVTGATSHPSWIFRPRQRPLTSFTIPQLERRLTIETGIAEMRMRAVQAGAAKVDDGDVVESMAEAADATAP